MNKKIKLSQMVLWTMLAGFVGITSIIITKTTIGESAMNDSIIIEKPPSEVFRILVDSSRVGKISRNIGNIKLNTQGLFVKGSTYKRVLYSHGIPNPQVVTIEEFEQDRILTTKTTLVGFDVTYRYILTPTSDGKALLSLQKDGQGGWLILKPLMIHLLTRPEHDGDHLARIKQLVEAIP